MYKWIRLLLVQVMVCCLFGRFATQDKICGGLIMLGLIAEGYCGDQRPLLTSSNGNIFRVTGPLWGESTGHRWIPLKQASDADLWCFLSSEPEQMVEQTTDTGNMRRHRAPLMTSPQWSLYLSVLYPFSTLISQFNKLQYSMQVIHFLHSFALTWNRILLLMV